MSPSVDYNILIKSSTGPSAVNSKAMVDNKVFPYLLLSIYTNIKGKNNYFFQSCNSFVIGKCGSGGDEAYKC